MAVNSYFNDDCKNWKICDIDTDLNKQLLQDFRGERSGFLQIGEKNYFFPKKFAELFFDCRNFETRHNDTWVITFPRSGTTWTQEMVWLLRSDLDYKTARTVPLAERFPFLEYYYCVDNDLFEETLRTTENELLRERWAEKICVPAVKKLEKLESPRFIKTHLPFSLLPKDLLHSGAKVIYVARNPKDVAVSFYHQHRLLKTLDFVGDFSKFWDYFERNLVLWAPYWEHISEGWFNRHHPNVKFMFYEDMKKDLVSCIKEMSKFFGKEYIDEEIMTLSQHLDISNFRENSAVNMEILQELGMLNNYKQRHIRNGKNGNWKEMFNKELDERADKWICENLKKTDIKFPLFY